jgi:two-component system OmpR family sensor kinase
MKVRATKLRSWGARMPLRVRLVVLMTTLVTVALVVAGFTATASLRGYLLDRVDSQLKSAAQQISDRAASDGVGNNEFHSNRTGAGGTDGADGTAEGGGAPPAGGGPGGAYNQGVLPTQPYYAVIFNAAGSQIGMVQGTTGVPDIPKIDSAEAAKRGSSPFTVGSSTGSATWRVVLMPLAGATGETVATAISLSDVDNTLSHLEILESAIGLVILVLLAGIGYLAVRRSLQPLIEVERTAEAIAAGDLARRVPEGDPRTEVGGLSIALNTMLSQIEAAFRSREQSADDARESENRAKQSENRMRRFITDASHELRTPLTSIRGFAELYRLGAVNEAGIERVMSRIEDESKRMGLLVEDLLLLARLDQQRPLQRDLVDVLTIASDAVHDALILAPDRDFSLVVNSSEPLIVVGDDARLRQVVGNLVTNAVTHTAAPASISVRVASTPDANVTIDVTDTGQGLSEEDAQRVFERFYRVDESRSRIVGGSGLGLSIVAALVAAHGGTVEVVTAPGQGSTFRVTLPLAAEAVAETRTESAAESQAALATAPAADSADLASRS